MRRYGFFKTSGRNQVDASMPEQLREVALHRREIEEGGAASRRELDEEVHVARRFHLLSSRRPEKAQLANRSRFHDCHRQRAGLRERGVLSFVVRYDNIAIEVAV